MAIEPTDRSLRTCPLPNSRLDGHWIHRRNDQSMQVDSRWLSIAGLPADAAKEFSWQHWLELLHPQDLKLLERGFDELEYGEIDSHRVDVRIRHSNGNWIWVLHHTWLNGGRQADKCFHGILQEITKCKRHEARLRKTDWVFERADEPDGVGSWIFDFEDERVTWSDETCRIHGYEPGHRPSLDEALGHFSKTGEPLVRRTVQQALDSGGNFDLQLPLERIDGERILVHCVAEIEYEDDQPIRICGAMQDTTHTAPDRIEELQDSQNQLERANERLSIATRSGRIGIWEFKLATKEFLWNDQMFEIYGLDSSQGPHINPNVWLSFLSEQDQQAVLVASRSAILGYGPNELEIRITRSDGGERHIYGTAHVVRDSKGYAVRLVGTNQDVTESRRMTRELARQREWLQVTLHSIGDGVITTNPAGEVIWLNPMAETMTGWSTADAMGKPLERVFNVLYADTRQTPINPIHACLDKDFQSSSGGDLILVSANSDERYIKESAAPIRYGDGEVMGAVLVFHDVTEQRRLANEMIWRATHDAMTGLLNRSEFELCLNRLFSSIEGQDHEHALLFIDLDQFKIVNDSAGHVAGDELLRQVSRLLEKTVQGDDTLVRLGGDEFAVIIEDCTTDTAMLMAQEICRQMDEYRFFYQEHRYRISASIGLVPINSSWNDVSAITRAADAACYSAKEAGRNRVHTWIDTDQAMQTRRVETKWATRLEIALDEDSFELYAQRIDVLNSSLQANSSGSLTGVVKEACNTRTDNAGLRAEVLLRLKGDGDTPILPGAFLPAAERYKLMYRIDLWVLDHLIEWLSEHLAETRIDRLWINFSGQSIGDIHFHAETLVRLRRAGPAVCKSLCVEITETAAITNMSEAVSYINELHKLGVQVALDDFGAGSSSFGYLKSLPVDYLKIDGQFVRNLINDPLDAVAVRCFVDVARVMGIKTVAEYVESDVIAEQLKTMGVDFAQGNLLQEPLPLNGLGKVGHQASLVLAD